MLVGEPGTAKSMLSELLAAAICAKGAAWYALQLPQQAEQRGSEYSAADMTAMGCTLQRYHIHKT